MHRLDNSDAELRAHSDHIGRFENYTALRKRISKSALRIQAPYGPKTDTNI